MFVSDQLFEKKIKPWLYLIPYAKKKKIAHEVKIEYQRKIQEIYPIFWW